ncbi:hypothetical protein FOZ61_004174 [Perkinsus olseni]|uniref:RING-type domain-containing protein n=1 Tax=Perkinsus olseni TaxID=32597 RepID=A0A7J6MUL3_PEROL|nr:hypothetical protein FOZ61_004174 [Perkinsus olseni]KAF4674900.1 hypothetical protein FOL46_003641 [Perkinsus olseni]
MRQQSVDNDTGDTPSQNPRHGSGLEPKQRSHSSSSSSRGAVAGQALLSAAKGGKTDIVRLLLRDSDNTTTVSSESIPANPFLLASGRYSDSDLGLALCEAARNGHSGVVKAIIETRPSAVKYADSTTGFNALHYAVMNPESGKVAATIVRMLLAAKCQLRNSVLHVCNNSYALALLLDYPGVDLEGLNRHRLTPLAAQVRADHADMAEELIRAGAKVPSSLLFSAKSADTARALLHAGADPNVQDAFGYTPLHLAVEGEMRSVARVLLEYKADPHKKAYDGITPLAMGATSRSARAQNSSRAHPGEGKSPSKGEHGAASSSSSPVREEEAEVKGGSSSSSSSSTAERRVDEMPSPQVEGSGELTEPLDETAQQQPPSQHRESRTFHDIVSRLDQLDDALLSYNAEVEEFPTSSAEWHGLEERMEFLTGKVRRLKGQAVEAEAEARRREKEHGTGPDTSKSLKDESLCVVCQTELRTVVLMPCRHMCVCTRCSERLGSECPLCRDHIKERLKVFT